KVDFVKTPEVLVIGLHVEIAAAQRDDLRARLEIRPRAAHDAVAKRVERTPDVVHLDSEYDVGLADDGPSTRGLIERMPRREVHAASLVDHCALQRLGEVHAPPP